jgi:CRISPR-associated protein Cas1
MTRQETEPKTLGSLHLSRYATLNFDGSLISSILPPMPVKADLRAAQFRACADPAKKFAIAKCIVQAKLARSLQVLDWLAQRYDIEKELRLAKKETAQLGQGRTVADLRSVEGHVATKYWRAYAKVLPEHLDFHGRMTTSHQNNASDPVNLALNYGYGFLEGECRSAINAVGLEPSAGFLHEFSARQTRQSLVYDLEEPFRWLIDTSVLEAFESGILDLQNFYFTGDDYRYRFDVEAKSRFVEVLRERFNSGVRYGGQVVKWDTIIEQKAEELGKCLIGNICSIDFSEPSPNLSRPDSMKVRRGILSLTQTEAGKLGIGKSTLHYLRKNAKSAGSFAIRRKISEKLGQLDTG